MKRGKTARGNHTCNRHCTILIGRYHAQDDSAWILADHCPKPRSILQEFFTDFTVHNLPLFPKVCVQIYHSGPKKKVPRSKKTCIPHSSMWKSIHLQLVRTSLGRCVLDVVQRHVSSDLFNVLHLGRGHRSPRQVNRGRGPHRLVAALQRYPSHTGPGMRLGVGRELVGS